ncbi:hypothetical protein [Deinococcus yavapaiensis]|uniref:Glycosyl hydrolase family 10 n=1 Tax=Deinococcus yavapaiensis KR-236 TaxID=694435 RepID=A0A318SBJ5_9DEIO|nr:hypothetical protein [Deinococcus yavapaiensis]PYE54571.1 hypothetical protein DES52_105211 [Deinococcus yavapaiensis KR-236]
MRFLALTALLLSAASARTALWLRPPSTPDALERTLVAAKAAGFTDVLLEGFYHGRTIWRSAVAPMKTSYDALDVAARVSRREGLNLSVWMETLYWRPAAKFGVPVTPLWSDGLATRTADGRDSLAVSDLGFVDPAEPRVGEVLEALVRELTARDANVGLHLDYLRYPREADFGFSAGNFAAFTRRTGKDARAIRKFDDGGNVTSDWHAWSDVRRDAVTSLANRLITAYRDAGGRSLVSAAVFSGSDPLQDWGSWRGLDVAMPMFYLPWPSLYPVALLPWPRSENVWPGVQDRADVPLERQLEIVRRQGFPNVAVFGWTPR